MSTNALAVWAGDCRAGLLDRTLDQRQYVFAYDQAAESPDAQVSLTMPVRLESWLSRDLHPIFQMNLPEGALLDAIKRTVAKITEADSGCVDIHGSVVPLIEVGAGLGSGLCDQDYLQQGAELAARLPCAWRAAALTW